MKRLPTNPLPINLPGCYLAGGSILSIVTKSEIADYDVYPKSRKSMIDIFYVLEENNCFIVNVSDRAVTWKCNDVTNDKGERAIIQVMTFDEFNSPERIFEFFDFSVCMAAFDADTNEYHFHPDFWPSVASKTLHFNHRTKFPLNSIIRVGKYTSKGYYLPKAESVKMSLAVINAGMPTSWSDLEAAIGGSYGKQLKLAVDGKEYSYETAMEILDNLELVIPDLEKDFSLIEAEQLESFFSGEKLKILTIEQRNQWTGFNFSSTYIFSNDILLSMSTNERDALDLIGADLEEIDPETVFHGYKVLKHKEGDSYENIIYQKKKSIYTIGNTIAETELPHIFVWPTYEKAKKELRAGGQICKFAYKAKDIISVQPSEYKVKEVFFEGIVNA